MRQEFAAIFEQAKGTGEMPSDADAGRLARRFQANIAAQRFELHLRTSQEEISALAEDMAKEITHLQNQPADFQ